MDNVCGGWCPTPSASTKEAMGFVSKSERSYDPGITSLEATV